PAHPRSDPGPLRHARLRPRPHHPVRVHRDAELVFTARRVEAAEARELGLVDELVDAGRDREEALALGGRIAANSPVGLRAAKRALRLGQGLDLRAGLEVEDAAWRSVAFSGDRAEGVAAFNEKRKPNWPGE
ncbi:enoyl-CoA hydratase/isomerase family protein, partial [Streptomyces clavifer]